MRARLGQNGGKISFRAICNADMVGHLNRVVTWAGGDIASREERPEGVVLHITK